MKRKVVILLLALALSAGVTACTDANKNPTVSGEESTSESGSQAAESINGTETEPTKETGSEIDDPGTGIPAEVKEENILFNGYYSDRYFCVDGQGNVASEYDWNAVKKGLADKGLNYDAAYVRAVGDGMIFFYQYEDINENWGYRLYAVDVNSLEVKMLWESPINWWLNDIDYYQGKLWLFIATNDNVYDELVFVKDDNSFRFHLEEDPVADVIKSLKGYGISLYAPSQGEDYGRCSAARVLDETGFLIGNKDNVYYKITKDGMISRLSAMPNGSYVYIRGYDEAGAIFGDSDYRTGKSIYKAADFATGSIDVFYGGNDTFTLLTYADGKVYYSLKSDEEYVIGKTSVYQYDVKNRTTTVLYEMESVPGATNIQPGTQNFQVINGQIYYVDLVDGQLGWVKRDPATGTVKDLGLTVGEKSAFRYGTVICESHIGRCSNCGIPLEKNYQEEFQLDAKYSAHADKINQVLRGGLQWVLDEKNESEPEDDEDCQEHLEYPTAWCVSIENEVDGVNILSDKYLAIDYSGYWYGGGAHGMPDQDQRIFDLQTGEEVGLKDFYEGTEEDFKKLVAEKTREDFLSYDYEMSPYFAESPDEVYEQAYKQAAFDTLQVIFRKNGAYVVYPPYGMGPYASGFIEIYISYQELLGRDHL